MHHRAIANEIVEGKKEYMRAEKHKLKIRYGNSTLSIESDRKLITMMLLS